MAVTAKPAPHEEPKQPAPPAAPHEVQKDPNVTLVSEEQLRRSEEMERVGVAKWMADHDSRGVEREPHQVPGVSSVSRK